MAKLAPLTATFADRNLARRCRRAASASAGGSSVRPGSTPAISRRKISRISARLRWIAGTRMCDGLSSPSCTISSARSVSYAAMPASASASLSPISWVAIDLTLTTSVSPVRRTRSVTMLVRLVGVAGPVHDAAARGDRALEGDQVLVEAGHGRGLDRLAGAPQLLPVVDLGDDPGALGPDGARRVREVVAQLGVGERGPRGHREGLVAAQGTDAARRGGRQSEERLGHAAPSRSSSAAASVDASTSARCSVRVPARSRDSPPPMCMRHDESPAVSTSAPVSSTCRILSASIAVDVSAFLTANVPPKPQHWSRRRQLDQVEAAHLPQQPQRLVADAQHPQRVAGGVVGDPVREVRADVLDAEHVDQQLGQLVGPARRALGGDGQLARRRTCRATIACWCRTQPTHDPDGATTTSQSANTSVWCRTSGSAWRW